MEVQPLRLIWGPASLLLINTILLGTLASSEDK